MNYIMAFVICLLCTFLAWLTGKDPYWLFISDGNVALTLIIAWYLDKKHSKNFTVNINLISP